MQAVEFANVAGIISAAKFAGSVTVPTGPEMGGKFVNPAGNFNSVIVILPAPPILAAVIVTGPIQADMSRSCIVVFSKANPLIDVIPAGRAIELRQPYLKAYIPISVTVAGMSPDSEFDT
jgi:hypothetical protein